MGQHYGLAERSPHQRHYKQSGRDVRQYQSAHRRNRRQRGDDAAGMERQRVFDDIRKTFTYKGQRFTVRGRTEKEAREKQYQLMRDLENGIAVKQHAAIMRQKSMTGDLTVSEYSQIWLETYIKPKIRKPGAAKQKNTIEEKSYDMYVYKLSGTIIPAIGDLKLREVVDTHLQQVLNDEKYKGRSKSHCEKVKIVMNAMFRQAVKSRLIQFNPAEDLIVTAEEGEGHRSLTPYEREVIQKVAKNPSLRPLGALSSLNGIAPW